MSFKTQSDKNILKTVTLENHCLPNYSLPNRQLYFQAEELAISVSSENEKLSKSNDNIAIDKPQDTELEEKDNQSLCSASTGDLPTATLAHPKQSKLGNLKPSSQSRSSFGSVSINQKVAMHYKKFINLPFVRVIRKIYHSLLFNLFCKIIYVFIVLLTLIIGVGKLDNLWFPSVHYYNIIHIVINVVGHLLLLAVYEFCKVLHITVLAGTVCRSGATIQHLSEGIFSGIVPGVKIRQILMGLAMIIEVYILLASYFIDFNLTPNYYKTGHCVDVTYSGFTPPPDGLMMHILGNAEPSNINNFVLPLADGTVGGCAVWPMDEIPFDFELKSDGYVYSVTAACYEEVSSKKDVSGTQIKLVDVEETSAALFGKILIQIGANGMRHDNGTISEFDHGLGVEQICTFAISFGKGAMRTSFKVDEWNVTTLSEVLEIDVPGAPLIAKGSSGEYFESEISRHLNEDQYGFVPYVGELLEYLIGMNVTTPTDKDQVSLPLLRYSTYTDGLYSRDLMYRGVSVMLSIITSYAMEQYEVVNSQKCDYFAWDKSGELHTQGDYFMYTQILCIAELCLIVLTLGWVYLSYRVLPDSEAVYHSLVSPIDLLNEGCRYGQMIFVDAPRTLNTLPGDLNERYGSERIYYGIKKSTIESDNPEMEYGTRKGVLDIRKVVKRIRANRPI